jgi:multidrug efflux pump
VLGGMLVGTVLGVFFIPLFFVVVQRVFNRKKYGKNAGGSDA